jgi:hypothetical protein
MAIFIVGNVEPFHLIVDKICLFPDLPMGKIADGGAVSFAVYEMKLGHDLAAGKVSGIFTLHLSILQIFLFLYCPAWVMNNFFLGHIITVRLKCCVFSFDD